MKENQPLQLTVDASGAARVEQIGEAQLKAAASAKAGDGKEAKSGAKPKVGARLGWRKKGEKTGGKQRLGG